MTPDRRTPTGAIGDMRPAVVLAVVLTALACSGGTAGRSPSPTTTPVSSSTVPPDARPTSGGCGQTQVYTGPVPDWLDAAAGHNVPAGRPYVIAAPAIAAGFLFAYPLRAGQSPYAGNKILWAVRTPRRGSVLEIDGHPLGSSQPTVHDSRPANSSPGEIYPDGVDVPSAGCWHLSLSWATGHAEIDLAYL